MLHEALLGSATLMPAGSVLRDATLGRFKSEHEQLRAALQGQFKQFEEECKSSLSQHRYAQVTRALQQCEKMAQAAVGEDREWGAPVPSFHKRVSKLLEHVETNAQEQVGDLREVTRQLQDLSSLPTQQASHDDLVCMFACVCVCMCVCVCVCVLACAHVFVCMCVRACMGLNVYVCAYACARDACKRVCELSQKVFGTGHRRRQSTDRASAGFRKADIWGTIAVSPCGTRQPQQEAETPARARG